MGHSELWIINDWKKWKRLTNTVMKKWSVNTPLNKSNVELEGENAPFALTSDKYKGIINEILSSFKTAFSENKLLDYLERHHRNKNVKVDLKISNVMEKYNVDFELILERHYSAKRIEKENKDILIANENLLRIAKKCYPENETDDKTKFLMLIEAYNRIIKEDKPEIIYWSDKKRINYQKTMDNVRWNDDRKARIDESTKIIQWNRIEIRTKITNELSKRDYKRLDELILHALTLKNKLWFNNWLHSFEIYLNSFFTEPKLSWEKAIKYFSKKYLTSYGKKNINNIENKKNKKITHITDYFNDREIKNLIVRTKSNDEKICKLRGEDNIIYDVINAFNFLHRKKVREYIDAEQEVKDLLEKKLQSAINIYYEILYKMELYYSNSQETKIDWGNSLDLNVLFNEEKSKSIFLGKKMGSTKVEFTPSQLVSLVNIERKRKIKLLNNSHRSSDLPEDLELDTYYSIAIECIKEIDKREESKSSNRTSLNVAILENIGLNRVQKNKKPEWWKLNFRFKE